MMVAVLQRQLAAVAPPGRRCRWSPRPTSPRIHVQRQVSSISLRQHLPKPNDVRADEAAAAADGRRLRRDVLRLEGVRRSAAVAAIAGDGAVQVIDRGCRRASWRSSMFCVMRSNWAKRGQLCQRDMARVGLHRRDFLQPFHVPAPDQAGVCGEARLRSKLLRVELDHSPVAAPRKVATPDSALTPAPVRQATAWASRSRAAAAASCSCMASDFPIRIAPLKRGVCVKYNADAKTLTA